MQSLRHCMTSMFSAYSPTITIGNAFAFRLKNACNAHVGTLVGTIEGVLRMCFRKLFAARIICASDEGPRLPSSDNSPCTSLRKSVELPPVPLPSPINDGILGTAGAPGG